MLSRRAMRALQIPPTPTWTPDDTVTCQRCGAELRSGDTRMPGSGFTPDPDGCIAKSPRPGCLSAGRKRRKAR